MEEEGYARAGSVEMLMVDAACRNQGIGTALLTHCLHTFQNLRRRPEFVDALGAWPFGYVYNALADGSERSGVFLREKELYRLFRRAGFDPMRKSLVMRADLADAPARPGPPRVYWHVAKRQDNSWLDRVFRNRELWDHIMADEDYRILSRAIFGLMENESLQEGKAIFSLFGVNTPDGLRQRGYAAANIARLMRHIASLGAQCLELHVYADNAPALALYQGLGFRPVAETMMMHKKL